MSKIKLRWSFGPPRNLGIDLGTANTLIFVKGRGIVISEPSVVALDKQSDRLLAVGKEAWEMVGRTPGSIVAVRPLKDGVIADFETTHQMLRYFMEKAVGRNPIVKPRIIISIPYGTTQVERRAVSEAGKQAGAKEVFLVEEPLAAGIGANLPVEEAIGNLVVNIGGGTSEIAVIALGGIIRGISLRSGGDALNNAIQDYLRKRYRLEIGERTSEDLKIAIGFATEPDPNPHVLVKGINLKTGMPAAQTVTAEEINQAITGPLNLLISQIKKVYERTPPQLATDITANGIILTGGGSQLRNLDRLIAEHLKLPARIADEPMSCVVKGTAKIISQMRMLKRLQLYRA